MRQGRPSEKSHQICEGRRRTNYGAIAMLDGLLLQKPHIKRPEHENDYDVHYQPLPEPVPEEQEVHADHDDYQRKHVKHDGCQISHPSLLLRATRIDHPLKCH